MDKRPTVGAIAQKGDELHKYRGHVAIVEEILGNGNIIISESSYTEKYNSSLDFEFNRREVSPNSFDNYIHLTK